MKMTEIELSSFVKTKSKYGGTDPYTISFVYHPDGNCIVKGMLQEVKNYIKKYFPRCIYRLTMWCNGQCRGSWRSPLSLYIMQKEMPNGKRRFVVSMQTQNGYKYEVTSFRRVPRKWLDIYNQAI